MNSPRLPWTRLAAKPYRAMAGVNAALADSSLGAPLLELVQARVSQINGCAFCLDMHARTLRKLGEGWQRINSLATWREAEFYDERERAALNWAEALTRVAAGHGEQDDTFDTLQVHMSAQEIVELTWAIAQINAWNRMAIGMKMPPSRQPLE